MGTIDQTYNIKAPAEKVWQALVDPSAINSWGGGPATMSDVRGSNFSLWGGDIFGTNTGVKKQSCLEQDWYGGKDWKEPSRVSFTLEAEGDATIVKLHQENVPVSEREAIESGWRDYYLGPMKKWLESEAK